MRLSCPNCAAEYQVAPGLLPPDGRHVQCTACHTRWFARPETEAGPEEDAILRRLETRGPRIVSPVAPVVLPTVTAAVPAAVPATASAEAEFLWEHQDPAVGASSEVRGETAAAPAEEAPAPALPPLQAAPRPPRLAAEPSGRDTAGQAGPGPGLVAPLRAAERVAPSGHSRLDLTVEPDPAGGLPKPPSRFGHGLFAAAVCVLLAVAVYLLHGPIAAAVPSAAPAIDAYSAFIDGVRERIADILPEG